MVSREEEAEINEIKGKILSDEKFVEAALIELFARQTLDEQLEKQTKHLNFVGFDKADGYILADLSAWILNGNHLSDQFLAEAKARLSKYAKQLNGYENVHQLMSGHLPSEQLIAQCRPSLNVAQIDPSFNLSTFIEYKQKQREDARKERARAKRQEAKKKKLLETCTVVSGTIKELRPKSLKVLVTEYNAECWIPKFAIKAPYREDIGILQEFVVRNDIIEEKKAYLARQTARQTARPTTQQLEGTIVEARPKALKVKINEQEYWFPKFAIKSAYNESSRELQAFSIQRDILIQKGLARESDG